MYQTTAALSLGNILRSKSKGGMATAACMKNYRFKVKNMLAQIALLGIVLCAFTYQYANLEATVGLLIGLLTGSLYFLYLFRQVENVQVFSVKQAVEHIRGGWVIRLAAMLLVLVFITHVLKVNMLAFVAGFFVMPGLLFINGLLLAIQQIIDAKKM
jgi:membrane protein YqaA with SNARE-associated domain